MRYSYFSAVTIICLLAGPLSADIVTLRTGKVLENVKTKVNKETVEILHENGTREIKQKADLKSIKLREITWNDKKQDDKKETKTAKTIEPEKAKKAETPPDKELTESKEIKKETPVESDNSKVDSTEQKLEDKTLSPEEKLAALEEEREQNFAVPEKIQAERKRHEFLMKERLRLQYTEGLLSYAGGQSIHTEFMLKINNRYQVRNKYGLLYLTAEDFGEDFIIETDHGKEKLDPSKIQAVKEEKFMDGYVYITSGDRFKGKIERVAGDTVTINSTRGEMTISANEILYPPLPAEAKKAENSAPVITLAEGEFGQFTFRNGQVIKGKLIKYSKNYLALETVYGVIELDPSDLVSAIKEEPSK